MKMAKQNYNFDPQIISNEMIVFLYLLIFAIIQAICDKTILFYNLLFNNRNISRQG